MPSGAFIVATSNALQTVCPEASVEQGEGNVRVIHPERLRARVDWIRLGRGR